MTKNVAMISAFSYDPNALSSVSAMVGEVASLLDTVLPIVRTHSVSSVKTFSAIPAVFCTVASQTDLTVIALQQNVVKIDLDMGGGVNLADSVPLIDADERQNNGNRGGGVVVAVLDSGIDQDHPNLADRLIDEACFADSDLDDGDGVGSCPDGTDNMTGPGSAVDDSGHGTHVRNLLLDCDFSNDSLCF